MDKKRCSKCSKLQLVTEFHNNKRNRDGRDYYCKTCYSNKYHNSKRGGGGQVPWRQAASGFRYKSLNDPEYIKDRNEIFAEHGHGWWWGWTKDNTPLPGIYSPSTGSSRAGRPSTVLQKIDEVRRKRDKEYKALGIGEFIECEMCGRETVKNHHKTKYCSKTCSEKRYRLNKQKREPKT